MNNGNSGNRGYSNERPSRSADRRPAQGSRSGSYARSGGTRPSGSGRNGNNPQNSRPTGGRRPASDSRGRNASAPNGAVRRTSSQRHYQPADYDDEKLPFSVYIGIIITVVAVIALIVSISLNSQRKKNRKPAYEYDFESSQTEVSDTYFEDVSDESDDEPVSSQIEYKSFLGTWYKSDVEYSERVMFSVSMQYSDSFEFRLELWNGTESKVINETAFYTDEAHAEYSPKKNTKIVFERVEDGVTITHSGKNSAFGLSDKFSMDGKFTEFEPEAPQEDHSGSYDYNLYQSGAIVRALKDILSDNDYAMYQDMIQNGLKTLDDSELTTDKNGTQVNVDEELNAVKYYAHSESSGYDMIFICSQNANLYLLFYNNDDVIYCTNDRNYSTKMPSSFQKVADAKGVKPTFR